MSKLTIPQEGGCRCGQVRLTISAQPFLTMACHCTGCQKMSSSAFSLSAAIPAEGFEIIAGEPVIGGLHGGTRHYFCPHCMTWMFTRPEGMDWFVNLRSTARRHKRHCPVHRDIYQRETALGDNISGTFLRGIPTDGGF